MIRGRMMKMGRQGDGEDRYRTAGFHLPSHYSATPLFCHPIILPSIVLPLPPRRPFESLSAEGRAADSIAVGVIGRGVQAAGQ